MTGSPNNLNILLIDPYPGEARRLKKHLRQINHWNLSIKHVRHTRDALYAVESDTFDLILLEYDTGAGDGLSLARKIRLEEFETPIVMLTNEGDEQVTARAFRIGVDDCRVKEELTPELLFTTLKYAITQRQNKIEQKRAARFDGLTNLYNRRFSLKRIREELKSAVRHNLYFSLCLIDLDGFKSLNDRLGHVPGDSVLKRTAELIDQTVRSDDIVGRYGGDEFMIGLRNTDSSGAVRAARKISNLIGNHTFHLSDNREASVSCSVGVAKFNGRHHAYDDGFVSVEEFIDQADKALYRAKEQGAGSVERRRHKRTPVENPLKVTVDHQNQNCTAELVEYSRKGARIREAPFLQEGNEITLRFQTETGQKLEEKGIIRSCRKDDDSGRAVIGIELDFPLQVFQETHQSSSVS